MIICFETPFTTFFKLSYIFLPRQLQVTPSQKHMFKPKKIYISKKKNTARLIQDDGKLVKIKEKEKILGVWVNTRSRIICNTSKM